MSDASKPLNKTTKTLLWSGAILAALAASNALLFSTTPRLESALDGETHYHVTPFGDMFYKKKGNGPSLLLVHGIGAGCSSHEFRHIWNALAEHFTVYAPDLIGFGKSDKPARSYSADFMEELLRGFVRDVIQAGEAKVTHVIGSSLGAAFVIRLAARNPAMFDKTVLVCPTGIKALAAPPSETPNALRPLLQTPVLGATLYNLITSHVGIQAYLRRAIYADPDFVTWDLTRHYHRAAHQAGSPNAILDFATGGLNAPTQTAFAELPAPLVVWGDAKAVETPVKNADAFLQANPRARLVVVPHTGLLPHEEKPEAFLREVLAFLGVS